MSFRFAKSWHMDIRQVFETILMRTIWLFLEIGWPFFVGVLVIRALRCGVIKVP